MSMSSTTSFSACAISSNQHAILLYIAAIDCLVCNALIILVDLETTPVMLWTVASRTVGRLVMFHIKPI